MIFDYLPMMDRELFFVYCLRYHLYSGEQTFQNTCRKLLGITVINSVLFPTHAKNLCDIMGISVEEYIKYHSAVPFYRVFLKENEYEYLIDSINEENYTSGIRLPHRVRCKAGVDSHYMYYCPECIKEKGGYRGIQIYHQLEDVIVCAKHRCYLKREKITCTCKKLLDINLWDMDVEYCEDNSTELHIAKDIEYIIKNRPNITLTQLEEMILVKEIKLVNGGKALLRINDEWREYYKTLTPMYKEYKDSSLKRVDGRTPDKNIEPPEYLIAIRALFGSFENMVNEYNYLPIIDK